MNSCHLRDTVLHIAARCLELIANNKKRLAFNIFDDDDDDVFFSAQP
jgi:hypothetical protein